MSIWNNIVDNLSFSYEEATLLEHLSLKIKENSFVALTGESGCGKSTLAKLLLGFYAPKEGQICICGKSYQNHSKKEIRDLIAYVPQEPYLYGVSIAENIAYGAPDSTREQIIEAAKSVYAHSFIKRLPDGYDTVISENSGLSQGQKQLICIARIMLMNPPMLILDEATSSIDLRTEQRIQKAFAKLMEGRTSFIIAHRLSTIKNSDTILVMKQGKIIEQGNHSQLMSNGGFYSELYNSQFAS